MNENESTDNETQMITEFALEDLQAYLTTAGSTTTERELVAWQSGYITGVNRAMGIRS